MDIEMVTARVANVRHRAVVQDDDEAAHAEEDMLYREVLEAIADGCPWGTAISLAREALKTQELDFTRHCA